MVWSNAPARVYHGTTLTVAQAIYSGASTINPFQGRAAADFGQGFYVTTNLHQAQQWANQKVRNLQPNITGIAAVLSFNMDRDLAGSHGDHLAFVVPNADFHDFVLFNRLGSTTHGRSVPPPGQAQPYDLVYGPVAAYPQTITYANCDQICFVAGGRSLGALSAPVASPRQGNPYFP